MKMEGEFFKINFDHETNTIFFEGSLRLWDPTEYQKIKQFMLDVHDLNIKELTLNYVNLEFMNSFGISILCKFILEIKPMNKVALTVVGNKDILWQKKSFENLKKLWDQITVTSE
ncbi:MAG: hypothetical protein A2Y33_02740 [Spirochaetes bacterium GWF1_51_8]|nr:MAG: hypothetical protein A2Y33_02740 [Spirochaetes bacterium GWF1_51_8]